METSVPKVLPLLSRIGGSLMPGLKKLSLGLVTAAAVLLRVSFLSASDKDVIPPELSKGQRDNLRRFLEQHDKPDRYVPADAKVMDAQPASIDTNIKSTPEEPIKQYMVQITSHRPVPGQEKIERVDVYYYRPNPEKGKPGITVRHTVDLTTGKQVGATEVLLNHHTPIARDELT